MNRIAIDSVQLRLIPAHNRLPLKFGAEIVTSVECLRVACTVTDGAGHHATGYGETPVAVQWAWPDPSPFTMRLDQMIAFAKHIASGWAAAGANGFSHPFRFEHHFIEDILPASVAAFHKNAPTDPASGKKVAIPTLASLVVFSAFDLALYDAVGKLLNRPVFSLFDKGTPPDPLGSFVDPQRAPKGLPDSTLSDHLLPERKDSLLVWHLIGGLDPLTADDPVGTQPNDGVPVFLDDWIRSDGLKALKVKLRGTDAAWDYERLVRVGEMAEAQDVDWLSADFNCCVHEPAYVTDILDRLRVDAPRAYGRLLYVEQPFPYELEEHPIDVHSVSARVPLFLDESAHDWRVVESGRQLGWNGVALKTCKTLTGALLSAAWAQASGMTLMVQDLTNPMLAMISHCQLAAHLPTIAGIECNAMQFYPAASAPEAVVHPGMFQRKNGRLDLTTIRGPGFGYRIDEIKRTLPEPVDAQTQAQDLSSRKSLATFA